MPNSHSYQNIFNLIAQLDREEHQHLSPQASFNTQSLRRQPEQQTGYRQAYAMDADRILHSRAYSRYIDKTQVFSLTRNDHITHRALHVQLVARIARTIGRFLYLNEDLIEAISLGHDIGHPPFGHDGESILNQLSVTHNLPPFQHNIHSVRLLDQIERNGQGWNLSIQTLDGILCHDGETHNSHISPVPINTFKEFDDKLIIKQTNPKKHIIPATFEGCVVRLADTIAYIGRDIEDAITLGLIKRNNIPGRTQKILGKTNGTIVYNLVTDLISNSLAPQTRPAQSRALSSIGFSTQIAETLRELKEFNYQAIYLHPETKRNVPLIKECYHALFSHYLSQLQNGRLQLTSQIALNTDPTTNMAESSHKDQSPASMACDFIAGMTDDFFLAEAKRIGCKIPRKQ